MTSMMPQFGEVPIMEYVRKLEGKVQMLQANKDRVGAGVFWRGFAWGVGVAAPVCWFLLRHGG